MEPPRHARRWWYHIPSKVFWERSERHLEKQVTMNSAFLVHPIRKEIQNPKNEPYPLKNGWLEARSSALVRAWVLPSNLNSGTLSRQLMYHNRFITTNRFVTTTNVAQQPDFPYGKSLTTSSSTFIFSHSFLHLMKKKDTTTQQSKKEISLEKIAEVISIQGFRFIYRWERSCFPIQIFNPRKEPVRVPRFSVNRISRRSTVAAKHETYLPVIMCPGFEKIQNLTPERSSWPMWQLSASCTTRN